MNFQKVLNFNETKDNINGKFQVRFFGEIKNLDLEDVIGIIKTGANDKISFSLHDVISYRDEKLDDYCKKANFRIIWRNIDTENYSMEVNFCPLGIEMKAHQLILYLKKLYGFLN